MVPGFVTPTHLLLMLAALAVFFILRKLQSHGARPADSGKGVSLRHLGSLRLRRPTRAQVQGLWLVTSALIAFAFTRAVALPLFLGLFFALWLGGYGVIVRFYR